VLINVIIVETGLHISINMSKIQVVLIVLFLGLAGSVFGQAGGTDSLSSSSDSTIWVLLDVEPSFKGGMEQMSRWLGKNLSYPPAAREAGIEGIVYIEFVVEKNGSVSNVIVKQGVAPILDEAAVKAVQSMPRWKPGRQKGKRVRCLMVLPIQFKLAKAE
jgi:periplasmic protein TonB